MLNEKNQEEINKNFEEEETIIEEEETIIEEDEDSEHIDTSDDLKAVEDNKNVEDENKKEKNRKFYEKRQQKKLSLKQEIENLKKQREEDRLIIEELKNKDSDKSFKEANNLDDVAFEAVKSQAKGSGKTYEEVLKSPLIQNYLETNISQERINSNSSTPPSNKVVSQKVIRATREDRINADRFFNGNIKRYLKYKN